MTLVTRAGTSCRFRLPEQTTGAARRTGIACVPYRVSADVRSRHIECASRRARQRRDVSCISHPQECDWELRQWSASNREVGNRSRYRRDGCVLRLLLVRGTEASSTANCSCSAPWQWAVCRVNWRPCYRRRGPKPLTAGGRGRRRKIASSWVESERPNRQGPRRSSAKSSSAARRWMGFDICRQSWLAPWISQFSWLFQETLHAAAMTPGDVEVNGGGARHWPRRSQCLPVLEWSTAPSRVAEISRYAGTGLSYLGISQSSPGSVPESPRSGFPRGAPFAEDERVVPAAGRVPSRRSTLR